MFVDLSLISQVFIPLQAYLSVSRVFECVGSRTKDGSHVGIKRRLNYSNLALGSLPDVRFAFAQVVLDTIYPLNTKDVSSEDLPEELATT